jgi:3-hydroxybutyryl-CoA dehydrogenase
MSKYPGESPSGDGAEPYPGKPPNCPALPGSFRFGHPRTGIAAPAMPPMRRCDRHKFHVETPLPLPLSSPHSRPDGQAEAEQMTIQLVGVIGAGQMGNGIAHVFALAGYDVLMTDISRDALDKAVALIDHNLERQVGKERITAAEKAAAMARIKTTLQLSDLGKTDLVIEAATERETVKQAIFEDLLPHLKPETILTSNTSSNSITRLATRTDRPEKFMGFHFMNPVPVMQLVELIRGIATDQPTYDALVEVVEKIGKTAASAEDYPAFIVNRILIPMINEAAFIKMEGVSNSAGIDTAMKLGANHPMGPLELGDFIGLDICLAIMDVLYKETGDSKYRACPLIRKMVRGGNLGCKSGKGFYVYNADRTKTPVDQL